MWRLKDVQKITGIPTSSATCTQALAAHHGFPGFPRVAQCCAKQRDFSAAFEPAKCNRFRTLYSAVREWGFARTARRQQADTLLDLTLTYAESGGIIPPLSEIGSKRSEGSQLKPKRKLPSYTLSLAPILYDPVLPCVPRHRPCSRDNALISTTLCDRFTQSPGENAAFKKFKHFCKTASMALSEPLSSVHRPARGCINNQNILHPVSIEWMNLADRPRPISNRLSAEFSAIAKSSRIKFEYGPGEVTSWLKPTETRIVLKASHHRGPIGNLFPPLAAEDIKFADRGFTSSLTKPNIPSEKGFCVGSMAPCGRMNFAETGSLSAGYNDERL
jgi:hypothetical protein